MLKRIYLAVYEDKTGLDPDMFKAFFVAKGWD
jgi:hypothetical protein